MSNEKRVQQIRDAARYKYPDERIHFIDGAKWADQHPQWIPVDERLPEIPKNDWKSDNVLFVVNGEIFYGYRGKYTWFAPFVSFNNHEVTHWMPLPQPPRKEEDNE